MAAPCVQRHQLKQPIYRTAANLSDALHFNLRACKRYLVRAELGFGAETRHPAISPRSNLPTATPGKMQPRPNPFTSAETAKRGRTSRGVSGKNTDLLVAAKGYRPSSCIYCVPHHLSACRDAVINLRDVDGVES
ncbi:hypothetical protein DPEC_G00181820 [Dallia pectoralis]|uniref:Uncharacterized protein n=1 Tax=Dallia pectoralis TaxID=75939 RepID=A0ACC2GAM2_DALPE|nr:hypothetical protein DPEC_G00181820 [Dallia pectoralis]